MEKLKQSTHGYSAHNSRVNDVSAGALNDDGLHKECIIIQC